MEFPALQDTGPDQVLRLAESRIRTTSVTVGRRYELVRPLGKGGMGTVFQATDLLTGNVVALKQVHLPVQQISFNSRDDNDDQNLALAQEFRALATIRHPNIISVYDFGFAGEGQPYITMEYIAGGRTILEYGKELPVQQKAKLIVQMLQALVYLHRRGILHRDLKPTNALVQDGRLKVLDFGLSVTTTRTVEHLTKTMSGTVAYMAPEIFAGEPYSRASDLYAVGVIAYELFTGQFPYMETNLAAMLGDIMNKTVDSGAAGVEPALALVLNRLLYKSRSDRYQLATDVIADLSAAAELPIPVETVEIRESFLQTAKFVGRQEQLDSLAHHLEAGLEGRGSAVFVGGESGVGKSRLLDELRVRALVQGVPVLQGQAIHNGRGPYHLWTDVLRSLVLLSEVDEGELLALKPLVPDIERLLGRPLVSQQASDLPGRPHLPAILEAIFKRLDQPVMILLEDLQWAGNESLQLLAEVLTGLADKAVLIVGTYRDDEPLPGRILDAPATIISLQRLTEADTAELSTSILGQAGADPKLIRLLQLETEGNAFFLVEAVRTLAEEAGRLDRVSELNLPDSIMSGGIRAILQRRLSRVPESAQPALKVASVASRKLDLALIQQLEPEVNLESWLGDMTSIAILEGHGEGWRFAHDKLREQIKDSLGHHEHHILHRRVAEGLEALYPADPEQAAMLTHHWVIAGDRAKARQYAMVAGKNAAAQGADERAITFFRRALSLLENEPESAGRNQQEGIIMAELEALLVRTQAVEPGGRVDRLAIKRLLDELEA